MTTDTASTKTSQKVSKPVIKLLIGFIAGLCAAFLPRLTASLAVSSGKTNVVLFDSGYITLSLIFAALVGLIVMILEWRVPREPRATFMMAIGVPALITGSLNTTTGVDTVASQAKENQQLVEKLKDLADIQTMPAGGAITPLSFNGEEFQNVEGGSNAVASLQWLGIRDAQAQTSDAQAASAKLTGLMLDEPLYYVVLAQANSKQEALQLAAHWRAQFHSVVPVQSGSRYLILYSAKPIRRSEAVLISIKVKQTTTLKPQLMSAK